MIRTIVYWGLCWGPVVLGNYQLSTIWGYMGVYREWMSQ